MLRSLHKIPGLLASILIVVIALSGTVLSVVPALQSASAPVDQGLTVAQLAADVARHVPGVTHINRQPSGRLIADYSTDQASGQDIIDPSNGAVIGPYQPSAFVTWMTNLHRALLLGNGGRIATALAAAAMVTLCLSGAWLMARRMGGWRRIFSRARGSLAQRLHVEAGRLVVLGLLFSGLTGLWMGLAALQVVPNGLAAQPEFPAALAAGPALPITHLTALRAIPLTQLRDLTYPMDAADAFTLSTASGQGYVDQATGQLIGWLPDNLARRVYETVYMLHTGQGLWSLGLLLGLAALGAPLMAGTGTLIWWRRRRALPRFAHNHGAHAADTIILVGSEGNATWGFARTLHDALTEAGYRVHTGAMNSLARRYPHAERMFIMTSTHGDGAAPASASSFLARLGRLKTPPTYPVALLGFGDRQFPRFSQFGHDVAEALDARRWRAMLPYDTIDRQSPQDFSRWGHVVGEALGHALPLIHHPVKPRSHSLTLASRSDYGHEVQAPISVLRFTATTPPRGPIARLMGQTGLPRFEAGDLVGILPPGSDVPRYYSLASSTSDGELEICVRKMPGGACSSHLHNLEPGDRIEAFIRPNPDFRPARGRSPIILIGAGTGIGPLTGFVRANRRHRPMHLYFGGRDPQSDFLYRHDLHDWLADRRLSTLTTAFSRLRDRAYVQHRIASDADHLRNLIRKGAQVMVCGGREMADGVATALDTALAPIGITTHNLKAEGRYVEDTY